MQIGCLSVIAAVHPLAQIIGQGEGGIILVILRCLGVLGIRKLHSIAGPIVPAGNNARIHTLVRNNAVVGRTRAIRFPIVLVVGTDILLTAEIPVIGRTGGRRHRQRHRQTGKQQQGG